MCWPSACDTSDDLRPLRNLRDPCVKKADSQRTRSLSGRRLFQPGITRLVDRDLVADHEIEVLGQPLRLESHVTGANLLAKLAIQFIERTFVPQQRDQSRAFLLNGFW